MSRPSGPRIRTFKPERWHDERFVGVSRDARHLYDGITTQADDEGRGTANLALIRATVLPFDDDATPQRIGEWLRELEAKGLLVLYEADGRSLFQIVSWGDDQRVDKPTQSKLPPPPEVPRDSSRSLANVPASRAPADRTGPDQDHSSSAVAAEAERESGEAREDVDRLCHLLAELMLANDAKARVAPDSKGWREAGRLLLDRDGRDAQLVEQAIRWCQANGFWRSNILSMPKLREKFPQLLLKMQAEGDSSTARPLSSRELCLRLSRPVGHDQPLAPTSEVTA